MPPQPPANHTPALRCLRCKHPFRISLDKLTKLLKCAHCGCHFRVTKGLGAGYVMREEGAAARPAPPASEAAPPPIHTGTIRQERPSAAPHVPAAALPNTDSTGTIRQERPPTAPHVPAAPLHNTDAKHAVLGKSTAPPAAAPASSPPRPRVAKPTDADIAAILAASTVAAKSGADAGDADRTVQGQLVPPPAAPKPRRPAPRPANSGPVPRTPTPRKPAPAAPAPRASGGRWKWAAALLGVLVLIAGGTAAAFYWLPLGKPAPVSLGKYGGVEIGSTGVKMVGVEYVKTDEGITETLLDEPTEANLKLGDLKSGASDFDDRALEKVADQVNDYFIALGKLGVPRENLYVACSSGVLSPFNDKERKQRNQNQLANAVHEKTGKDAAFIDAHDEAQFSFQELVPAAEWTQSVLLDVGGGNIKGGGYARKDLFLDFHVDAGYTLFEKKVTADKRPGESFADAAVRLRDTEVRDPLRNEQDVAQLKDRPKVYLLGGPPWAMATYVRPTEFYAPSKAGTKDSYLRKLQASDIQTFDELVRTKKPADIKTDVKVLVAGSGDDLVKAVNENVDKIQKEVFKNPDRLIGGAQILLVLDQEFALTAANKEVRSFRYGQAAWLLGYLKSKSGHTN